MSSFLRRGKMARCFLQGRIIRDIRALEAETFVRGSCRVSSVASCRDARTSQIYGVIFLSCCRAWQNKKIRSRRLSVYISKCLSREWEPRRHLLRRIFQERSRGIYSLSYPEICRPVMEPMCDTLWLGKWVGCSISGVDTPDCELLLHQLTTERRWLFRVANDPSLRGTLWVNVIDINHCDRVTALFRFLCTLFAFLPKATSLST